MERFIWVCVGGAAGTGARYLVTEGIYRLARGPFPYGTLAVNLVGSLLLGLLVPICLASEHVSPTARLALTTGVLGGFTTYSTFSYESMRLLHEGAWATAALYMAGTVVACLAASFAGFGLARALL